jgi:cysteine-rich repeat protein
MISLLGCDVTLETASVLEVAGNSGVNRIVSRRVMVINGELTADFTTGRNTLVYRDAANPPVIFAGATVIPREMLMLDPTLQPCAVCGNSQTEPPETCDDGNQEDGDGCSAMCQIEADPCDVDGDGAIDATDLMALLTELFDGDGDRAIDVGGGEFPGTIGTDANQDTRVTVADAVHCIEVLAE